MSLDCILLGILREPAAGYDIKQQFDNVFRHFWSADLAQIYRSLNRMEKDGLLTSRTEPSDKGPDRKVYRRTEAGRRMLNEWLQAGPIFGTEKFTYLAQIFFLGSADDPAVGEEFFVTLREELVAQLETFGAIEDSWKQALGNAFPDDLGDEDFYSWLTLEMGLRKTRTLVQWTEDSLARIRARQQRQKPDSDIQEPEEGGSK